MMNCKGRVFCLALTRPILSVQEAVEVKTSPIIASIFAGLIYWSTTIQRWLLTLCKAAALIPLFTISSRPRRTFLLIIPCHLFHLWRNQRSKKKKSVKNHKNQQTLENLPHLHGENFNSKVKKKKKEISSNQASWTKLRHNIPTRIR